MMGMMRGRKSHKMNDYYIAVHVKSTDQEAVRQATLALFATEGFRLLREDALASVVEDEDQLPEGDEWYGVIVSGTTGTGWISVYVADWPDSGVLARHLSKDLAVPVLELWVAESRHWGYNYFENGEVRDRFADDPKTVAETDAVAAHYTGNMEALAPILCVPLDQASSSLEFARERMGRNAAGPVDQFTQALGLPFAQAFTGYESFLDDDPEDYAQDLEDWPRFRHIAFALPLGREGLVG
jgi:hypothetical protein